MRICQPRLDRIIKNLHAAGAYRPVGVYILYDAQKQLLLTQSAFNTTYWGFPQGGIEPSESLLQNLYRELFEELRIHHTELTEIDLGFYMENLDSEGDRENRRGFSTGKSYIFSSAFYKGDGDFNLNREELADARFFLQEQAHKMILGGRKEKAELSIRALGLITDAVYSRISSTSPPAHPKTPAPERRKRRQ